MKSNRIKFDKGDPRRIEIGAEILYKAFKIMEESGNFREKTKAIGEAKRGYRESDLRMMPGTQALTDSLRDLIRSVEKGELHKRKDTKSTGRLDVVEKAMRRILDERKPAEELPGQMQMDLTPEAPAEEEKKEMSDQTKLMRFQAHEADLILKKIEEQGNRMVEQLNLVTMKLDRLNDTLHMIIRCIRKE